MGEGVGGVIEGLHYWGKFAGENVHTHTRARTHTAGLINGRAITSLRLSATIAPSRRRRIRSEIPGSGQTARGDIDRERGGRGGRSMFYCRGDLIGPARLGIAPSFISSPQCFPENTTPSSRLTTVNAIVHSVAAPPLPLPPHHRSDESHGYDYQCHQFTCNRRRPTPAALC